MLWWTMSSLESLLTMTLLNLPRLRTMPVMPWPVMLTSDSFSTPVHCAAMGLLQDHSADPSLALPLAEEVQVLLVVEVDHPPAP